MHNIPERSSDDNALWHEEDIVITDEPGGSGGLPPDESLTAWQRAWRVGVAPQLSTAGLRSLKVALERDDPQLITGATTSPPPLACMENLPVDGCYPLCWALLDGRKPQEVSVGPLEERFFAACCQADRLLGEPAAARYFLNQVDAWGRQQLIQNLIPEIERTLAEREQQGDSRETGAA